MERLSSYVLIGCFVDECPLYQAYMTPMRTTEQHFNKVVNRKSMCRARTHIHTHFARIGNLRSLVLNKCREKLEKSGFSGKNKGLLLVLNPNLVQEVIR